MIFWLCLLPLLPCFQLLAFNHKISAPPPGNVCSRFFLFSLAFLQKTVTRDGQEVELRGKGRHDPCVLPRAVPMVEAMVAITLVDHLMMQQAQCELFPNEAAVEDLPNPMGTTAHREGGPAQAREMEEIGGAPVSQRIDEE